MHASTRGQRHNRLTAAIVLGLYVGMGTVAYTPTVAAQAAEVKRYDLPAGTLDEALAQFGRQSGLQMLVPPELVAGHRVEAISGEFTNAAALKRLLRGTGLSWERIPSGTVVIKRNTDGAPNTRGSESSNKPPQTRAVAEPSSVTELDAIVVTGTHIRGRAPVGSPLDVWDRGRIEQSGAGSVEQLLSKIPQNSSSTAAETFFSTQQGINTGRGTAVDLRGLGAGATLVLLNGHRLAPAGDGGTFADVSAIPLTAVDRVEILTDGASAIYGADAVAGVVNFVLRRDFRGAETSLRYADTTQGGAREMGISQLFGTVWDSGQAMLSLDHSRQDAMYADQRDFIPPQTGRLAVLPEQERNSVFASGRQALGAKAEAFADLFASRRKFVQDFFSPVGEPLHADGDSTAYDAVMGIDWDTSNGWRTTLTGNYSKHEDEIATTTSVSVLENNYRSVTYGVDGRTEGPIFTSSAGEARLVVGGSFRREQFDDFRVGGAGTALKRDISSVFGELVIPLLAPRPAAPGTERLAVSLAARYDDYSDAGSSVGPKIGAVWSPLPGLSLRSTYGKSFRAAPLSQTSASNPNYFVFPLPDSQAPDLTTTTLFLSSPGNPQIGPERSRSFTVGIDIQPTALPELKVSATYFDIRYRDRIALPPVVGSPFLIYSQRDTLAPFIDASPDPAEVARIYELYSVADALGVGGAQGEGIESIFDFRLHNISETRTSGVDFSVNFTKEKGFGSWRIFLDGSYLLESDAKATSDTQVAEVLNTVFNPMDLRLRAGVGWSTTNFSSSLSVNYSDDYENNLINPVGKVDSWTVLDYGLAYRPANPTLAMLQGTRISLYINNIADRDPPRLPSAELSSNLGYDVVNASAKGRSISLEITKSW